ncbi:unnamed protein product [Somion occarium]|uniref:Uncharacterized protein n=1 Tax=Somion occarium TaxID=3059160 RepID=A0ABP1CK97_9APHY
MTSLTRPQHNRRRSHSASPSLSGSLHLDEDKWRKATRRARPSALRVPSYKNIKSDRPEKWDVDLWRRGKRIRKGPSSPKNAAASIFDFAPSIHDADSFNRVSSGLPSTSAAFELFPHNSRRSTRSPRHTPRYSEPFTQVDIEIPSVEDTSRLRTDAFWDLRRSIADSGEGLVSRMREWESTRSQPVDLGSGYSQQTRGRKRVASQDDPSFSTDSDAMEDDEDDILIVSHDDSSLGPPPRKKRAVSLGLMDVDPFPDHMSFTSPAESERCHSPSSVDVAEGEKHFASSLQGSSPITPPLTHASANSSQVSLPLSAPSLSYSSPPTQYPASAGSLPGSTASRSEKAIAAITLAMANGAGGLNDYADVLNFEGGSQPSIDDSLVGDMWH